jgi:hypothetical protein
MDSQPPIDIRSWFKGEIPPKSPRKIGQYGVAGVYRGLVDELNKRLIVGGNGQKVVLPDGYADSSLTSFVSTYQRDELHCYENGWRFSIETLPRTDGCVTVGIRKVTASTDERDSRSKPRGKRK